MRLVFFGSSKFALPFLKKLIESGHEVVCVVTQPDKKGGRGMHLSITPVKDSAEQFGLKIYQPSDVKASEVREYLKKFSADLFVVIAYGQILPQEILDIPKFFSVNVHASLLPKYRGAAPLNWSIIKGEKTTGVTVIKMDSSMDTGPVISQEKVLLNEADTAQSLGERLSNIGSELLLDTIKSIEEGKFKLTPQNASEATMAPKMKKENGMIDWSVSAEGIFNLVRGCAGWPGAFTYLGGKLLKIYKVKVNSPASDPARSRIPGEVMEVSKDGVVVAAGTGSLIIQELQLEGKKHISAEKFETGNKVKIGMVLGKK